MEFEFATANRILFGPGTSAQIGTIAGTMGTCALLVTGASPRRAEPVRAALIEQGLRVIPFSIPHEPILDLIQTGAETARSAGCDLVIAVGGGSAIDAGKAMAALITNHGPILDYLEVIGQGKPLTTASLPMIAVPTTAGTGAEVTRNAVVASPDHRVKVSLRSPSMLPTLAVVDPELTRHLPPGLTASTGMDALTQVLEPYVSPFANPMTDALCREGLWRAAHSLEQAFHDGEDMAARSDMALASLMGGVALANAKLGAVHGFAGPIGGMFHAPHGAICAALLPPVMEMNIQALAERMPRSPFLHRYHEIARILTGQPTASPTDGVARLRKMNETFGIPSLAAYGITPADFPPIVAKAQASSSMRGNPISLTEAELVRILEKAI